MPPLQDPILLFLHTFSLKSAYVIGQNPPKMGPHPPWKILDLALYKYCFRLYLLLIYHFTCGVPSYGNMEILTSKNRMSTVTFLSFYFYSRNGARLVLTIQVQHSTILMEHLLHTVFLHHFYYCSRYLFWYKRLTFIKDCIFAGLVYITLGFTYY